MTTYVQGANDDRLISDETSTIGDILKAQGVDIDPDTLGRAVAAGLNAAGVPKMGTQPASGLVSAERQAEIDAIHRKLKKGAGEMDAPKRGSAQEFIDRQDRQTARFNSMGNGQMSDDMLMGRDPEPTDRLTGEERIKMAEAEERTKKAMERSYDRRFQRARKGKDEAPASVAAADEYVSDYRAGVAAKVQAVDKAIDKEVAEKLSGLDYKVKYGILTQDEAEQVRREVRYKADENRPQASSIETTKRVPRADLYHSRFNQGR